MKKIFLYISFLLSGNIYAQYGVFDSITVNTSQNDGGTFMTDAIRYLPTDYNPLSGKRWPLIIDLHGAGEAGNNLTVLLTTGIPNNINAKGQLPILKYGSYSTEAICIFPQSGPSTLSTDPNKIANIIRTAFENYKVDSTRVYLTGLSGGGNVLGMIGGYSTAATFTRYNKFITAIFVRSPHNGSMIFDSAKRYDKWRPAVGFVYGGQSADGAYKVFSQRLADSLDNYIPGRVFQHEVAAWGHNNFIQTFDTAQRYSGLGNKNVYEFLASYTNQTDSTGTTYNPTGAALTANAGTNITTTIYEPQVELNGTASTGNITSVSWRLITTVYGNSNGSKGKLVQGTSLTPGVKALSYWPGGWNYELTVSDGVTTDKDTVNVYVSWPDIPSQQSISSGCRLATFADSVEIAGNNPGACRINYDVVCPGANGYGISGGDSVGNNYLSLYVPTSQFPVTDTVNGGVRLFIKGGVYKRIEFPHTRSFKGTAANPNIVTYYGNKKLEFEEFIWGTSGTTKHVHFTGKYIPGVCGTPNYQAYQDGNFEFQRGKFGMYCNGHFSSFGDNGFNINSTSADSIEVSFIEAGNGHFNAINLKKESANNSYTNVYFHDMYVHHSNGENFYIGSTQNPPQTRLYNLTLKNIISTWAGNENFQIGKVYGNTNISNSVLIGGGRYAYSPFMTNQDGIFQLGYVAGKHTIRDLIVMGTFMGYINQGNLISTTHPEQSATDTVKYINNLYLYNSGDNGGYLAGTTNPNTSLVTYFDSCRFGKYIFFGNDVYTNTQATNKQYLWRSANNAKYTFRNTWRDATKTILIAPDGGTPVYDTITPQVVTFNNPLFVNSGWPDDFDYNSIFNWVDTIYKSVGWEGNFSSSTRQGQVKVYDSLEVVMFQGKFYESKHGNNFCNMPIGQTNSHWRLLTWQDSQGNVYQYPPEDYRLREGDPYRALNMGLTYYPTSIPVPTKKNSFNRKSGTRYKLIGN